MTKLNKYVVTFTAVAMDGKIMKKEIAYATKESADQYLDFLETCADVHCSRLDITSVAIPGNIKSEILL